MIHKDDRDTEAGELPSQQSWSRKAAARFPRHPCGRGSRPRGGRNTGRASHSLLETSPCQRGQGQVEGEDGKSEVRQGYEGP